MFISRKMYSWVETLGTAAAYASTTMLINS